MLREHVISAVIPDVNRPVVPCVVQVVGDRARVDATVIVYIHVVIPAIKDVHRAVVIHVERAVVVHVERAVVENVIRIALLLQLQPNRAPPTAPAVVKRAVVAHVIILANQNVSPDVVLDVQDVVTHVQMDA